MASRATVDVSKAIHKIKALANELHRPLRDVLDSGARTCAISLAKSTQPDGTGAEAKSQGEKAVARDIYHVYGNAGGVFKAIKGSHTQDAFWSKYKRKDFRGATELARNAGIAVGEFDGGAAHRAELRHRRPVIRLRKPKLYIIQPRERQKLEQYIKFHQEKVGTAKGGWVDCVRVLGGTPRGLKQTNDITANWITRKGRGYGSAAKSGSDFDPKITIKNRIEYVGQLLSNSARGYAIRVAYGRMVANLNIAAKAAAKKLRS